MYLDKISSSYMLLA